MNGSQTAFSSTAGHCPGGNPYPRLPRSGVGHTLVIPAQQAGAKARRARGFTLIEVLITVAIVAILITVALPSYSTVTVKVNRSAAAQFMMDVANREEQYLLDQRTYTATIGAGGLGLTPSKDAAANYAFSVAVAGNDCAGNALSGPGYVITATATGPQVRDGNLCIDSRNNKTPLAKWEL